MFLFRVSSSEGETTTSSQFIEKQRKELLEYMKALESQIGQLETLQVVELGSCPRVKLEFY